MRRILALSSLVALTACAEPMDDMKGADGVMAEPMVEEAPVAAAPKAEVCDDPGDGIGVTGCAVE